MSKSILITHATVFTMDTNNRVLRDTGVYTEGDRIISIGPSELLARQGFRPEITIDGSGKVILPGLIDTHVHLIEAIMRGLVPDDVNLHLWLKEWLWPLQQACDASIGITSAELCIAEMLRTGTTCFLEAQLHSNWGIEGMARAVLDSGIRGNLSKMVIDTPSYDPTGGASHPFAEDKGHSINTFRNLHRELNGKGEGRLGIWLGVNNPRACSDDLGRELNQVAIDHNTGLTMHVAETKVDLDNMSARGTTPGKWLEKTGLAGQMRVFAHGVWLTEQDISILEKSGASVAHCPSSNMKLGSGVAPVTKMIQSRLNVSLGCDGGPSNDCYDLIREMKTAALLHKVSNLDPRAITATEVLRMASINGAKAIGLEKEIGSIEVGKKADLVIIDLHDVRLYPPQGSDSNILYAASGTDVSHVIIDGRFVIEDRKFSTVDEKELLLKTERETDRLLRVAGKT